MKLAKEVVIPLGTCKRYMSHWDEVLAIENNENDNGEDFTMKIKYPPLNYNKDFYWNEMSYYKYTENSLTWNYSVYADGDWNMN